MKIVLYCADPPSEAFRALTERLAGTGVETLLLPAASCGRSFRGRARGAVVYLHAAAFDPERLLELGARIREVAPWGVLDPEGTAADPALLFRAGASDYVGPKPAAERGALSAERLERVAEYHGRVPFSGAASCADPAAARSGAPRPAFPGWGRLKAECSYPFVFAYAALGGQRELQVRLGEKRMDQLRGDFAKLLERWAEERGGILWIRDAASNLLLFPAADGARSLVPDLVKFQLDRLLISYESLHLGTPLTFRFAVHEGEAPWRRPGSTGTMVSESVNFIYHFGSKAVKDGSIGVSEAAYRLIPPAFDDLFRDGPVFEERRLRASRLFLR